VESLVLAVRSSDPRLDGAATPRRATTAASGLTVRDSPGPVIRYDWYLELRWHWKRLISRHIEVK
jgi:hypothetical protein